MGILSCPMRIKYSNCGGDKGDEVDELYGLSYHSTASLIKSIIISPVVNPPQPIFLGLILRQF